MNVVDSSGWLEFFADGPNAKTFAVAIQNETELLVPVICVYEVYKKIRLDFGRSEAIEAVALMLQGEVIEMGVSVILEAADISLETKLPMADSMILAIARLNEAILWTQDAHFNGLPGVKFIPKR